MEQMLRLYTALLAGATTRARKGRGATLIEYMLLAAMAAALVIFLNQFMGGLIVEIREKIQGAVG